MKRKSNFFQGARRKSERLIMPRQIERVLLKLSGGALKGADGPLSAESMDYVAGELRAALSACPRMGVVLGGGNIMRGADMGREGIRRHRVDQCGMMATVVNALALAERLNGAGIDATVMSATAVPGIAKGFEVDEALEHMRDGTVVLLAGGTGNTYFTTDSAAALRAVQLDADLMLKATRVKGVFGSDPEKNEEAQFHDEISYADVLKKKLGVMDLPAVALCMEHGLPVRVFDFWQEGSLRAVVEGEPTGTLIRGADDGYR